MPFKVTTQPAVEPVTLNEARAHLRVDVNDEDAIITSLIVAAREYCENYQSRSYITQTITVKLDAFGAANVIELPRPPLQSVSSIKYIDVNGIEQTLGTGIYDVDTVSEPGRVILSHGQSWPTDVRGDINGIEVVCVCGYGDASSVPQRIKEAIKLIVGHFYENRELTSPVTIQALPFGVNSLLNPEGSGVI